MEMEIELDSPSYPTTAPMPPSGDSAISDGTAPLPPPPPPPPSRQEPASPSPAISPPRDSRARRRRSKPVRAAPVDQGAAAVGSPRKKRRGAGEPRTAASPGKNVRRARRRLESDGGREETGKEAAEEETAGKTRRRKTAARAPAAKGLVVVAKEEKGSSLALVPCPPINIIRGAESVEHSDWEGLWEMVVELAMWKNVGRSAFWFGSGSMLFFSSSFSRDIDFSPVKVLCHFGVVMLGLVFFKDSIPQRQNMEHVRSFQLTEEDVLQTARAVLPISNSLISMSQVIFSGDPSMTLKVLPILLIGAKYGHLLTVWRLLATGFFGCFTLPKLYSCYSGHIHGKVEGLKDQILNAWKSCPRKKLVAAAAVSTFWNLASLKTRIMAAFVSIVTLRYYYKYRPTSKNSEAVIRRQEQQAMVMED